jgi:hypothetical protein
MNDKPAFTSNTEQDLENFLSSGSEKLEGKIDTRAYKEIESKGFKIDF